MIDFGLPLDVPHGVGPEISGVEGPGATVAASPNLSGAEASTTALKIHLPNDPYDGTVFDKDLWLNAPHPDDGDKVCEWAKDLAAAQPKAACDQWTSDDWDAWANDYGDNNCEIPKCGEDFPARLEPMYQVHQGDSYLNTIGQAANSNVKSQLALAMIPERVEGTKLSLDSSKPALLLPTLSSHEDVSTGAETPRQRWAKVTFAAEASMPISQPGEGASTPVPLPSTGEDDEDVSLPKEERTWMMLQQSRPSPAVFVLSCHAVTLAAVETALKGGNAKSFKEDVLANAGAVNPVSKALLKEQVLDVFLDYPEDGVTYTF